MFRYKAYGLVIDSEIEFPELLLTKENSSVKIRNDIISFNKKGIKKQVEVDNSSAELYDDQSCLIKIQDVGAFYISDTYEITFQSIYTAKMEDIRAAVLTIIIPALLFLKGNIAMHGSVIAFKNYCILLTGKPGAGKSTLAGALMNRGFRLVSDDICVIKVQDNSPFVTPAFPQLKLNYDSAISLGHKVSDLNLISERVDKRWVPVENQFGDDQYILKAIYEIKPADGVEQDELSILEAEKLKTIVDNTYKTSVIEFVDLRKQLFQQSVWLASKVDVYQLKRPVNCFISNKTLEQIVDHNVGKL